VFGTLAGCTGANVNLTFGDGNNRVLQSFNTAALSRLSRVQGLNEQVVFRRNPALAINGSTTRGVLFYEAGTITDSNALNTTPPPTAITLRPSQAADIEATLLSSVVNRGIDNVFHNQLGGPGTGDDARQDTRSNIERIDYILPNGVVVPPDLRSQEGFLVLERNGNDRFSIAAITSLNNGVPASYGPLVSVATTNWGNINDVQFSSVVFRREQDGEELRPSHTVPSQSVRGIFFPIDSLLSTLPADNRIFGYSIVAGDVGAGTNLVDVNSFPTTTTGQSAQGGLDLVAGGFGLFRIPRPGNLFLNKRITQLTAAGTVVPFPNTENPDNNAGFPELQAAGLGQGTVTVTNPQLQPSDTVDYALYFNNTGDTAVTNVQICDQIPPRSTFSPNTFGAGSGVQAIPPTNAQTPPVNYATANYTNAADGDPATYLPPGSPLPAICGTDRGNGAVVVTFPTLGPRQVGVVRFRTTVNPFPS
jgi:uncharacterized repeat protein (TIGR01451 family)